MRAVLALVFVLVTGVANGGLWWWFNRPVPVELSFNEKFPSVSFAPYRRGQSPLSKDYPPPAQIEEDLKSVAGVARGVRTYTSREGLDIVPELARKYGLEVTHSAWLGVELEYNDKDIEALIKAANDYPDVIKRVIVGNEVLLRKDLTVDQLIAYIRRVKAAVKQPVSYADVWAFWLKYPEVAKEVDFLTIHILPYWEDEPVAVEDSGRHLVQIYNLIHTAFPGKPILIGESGWPTRGRQRGPAVAGIENAARYVRTLAQVAKDKGFDYNVVEAFDQPWKSALEGTIGAAWGVVDSERKVKFGMSGPVEPSPNWRIHAALSVALGSLAGLFFLRRAERYTTGGALAVAALAQLLAGFAVWQGLNALMCSFSVWGDVWAWARILPHAGLAAAIVWVAGAGLRADGHAPHIRWAERLMPLYGLCGVAAGFLFVFFGRYRDIPSIEFLAPGLGILALGLARVAVRGESLVEALAVGRLFSGKHANGGFPPARQLALALTVAAFAQPMADIIERLTGDDFLNAHPGLKAQLPFLIQAYVENHAILCWSATLLVLSLPFWAEARRRG